MEKPHHRGGGAHRRQRYVRRLEFTGRCAFADHGGNGMGDPLHVGDADLPALLHRDLDHLVQLGIADIAFAIHAVDRGHQFAQAGSRRSPLGRDGLGRLFDPAHQGARDALMDRLFRIEKTIDVRRAHPQFFGDIGNRRLLIADLTEQTLRHDENPFSCVGFDMFRDQRHVRAHFSLLYVLLFRGLRKPKCCLVFYFLLPRMIMPASAISPSSATKPNGWFATLSPSDAPMIPSGAVRNTRIRREKLCSWIIRSVSMTITISGNRTKIDALPLADSSNAPPGSIR